jgi:hypothetical protein
MVPFGPIERDKSPLSAAEPLQHLTREPLILDVRVAQ